MRFLTILALLGFTLLGEAHAAPTCWPSNIGGTGGEATYDTLNTTGPYAGWHCPDGSDALYASRWGDVKGPLRSALRALQDLAFASPAERQAAAATAAALATMSRADVFEVWQDAATWKPLVKEGVSIINIASSGAVIRYGAGTQWVIKTVWSDPANPATRSLPCTNEAFTVDPAPNTAKGCELATFIGKAIPTPAPVYTHHVKGLGTCDPAGVCTRPVYMLAGTTLTLAKGRAVVGKDCDTTHPTKASGSDLYAEFGPAFAPGVVALCSTP